MTDKPPFNALDAWATALATHVLARQEENAVKALMHEYAQCPDNPNAMFSAELLAKVKRCVHLPATHQPEMKWCAICNARVLTG